MPKINISALSVHPLNEEIYEKVTAESVADLVDSISKVGMIEPIIVNTKHVIVSGHRRYKAAEVLGLQVVNYIVKTFMSKEEEEAFLITKNMSRVKTNEERIREGSKLKQLYVDMNIGGRINDKVADAIGMSRRSFEKGIDTMNMISQLERTDPDQAAEIRAKLGKNIDGANQDAKAAMADKVDVIIEEELSNASLQAQAVSEAERYFYESTLSVARRSLEHAFARLAAKRNGSTPIALGYFIGNIKMMADRFATWERDKLSPCPKCDGTAKQEDGNICPYCVAGKVGVHVETSI